MKVLILVTFVFAASSASLIHGPWVQHEISTVDANGLPLDTPEVAAAKIQHHHDFAVAAQRNGVVAAPASIYSSSYSHPIIDVNGETLEVKAAKIQHFAAHAAARSGHIGVVSNYVHQAAVIGPNGAPLETPEVQSAKAHHLAAHAEANARSGHIIAPAAVGIYGASYAHQVAVIGPNGAPLETPEVQAAKAHHLAAHAEANARSGHIIAPVGIYGASYAHQAAVIGPNGAPLETPEVQAAKAHHLAAHAEANARSGHIIAPAAVGIYGASYAHQAAVIGPNGAPLETPEVQAAKAHHLAAHAEANARSGHIIAPAAVGIYGASYSHHVPTIGVNGVPIETPEVQLAKASHLAAHAEVAHREWQW